MTKQAENDKINEINCMGLKCPLPVMRLEKAIANGAKDIHLTSDDPISVVDIPLVVTKLGGKLHYEKTSGNVYRFHISLE